MNDSDQKFTRRDVLRFAAQGVTLAGLSFTGLPALARSLSPGMITRTIPSSGESIPAIGMGTWITFNVGKNESARRTRYEIMRIFFERGGGMIDCAPMYGSSADVIGAGLQRLEKTDGLFSASKVWTWRPGIDGRAQIQTQRQRWGINKFDLVQVHNLVDWQEQLPLLQDMKANGDIRYIGVTTSHGNRHQELENIMKNEDLDFVQFSYNIANLTAENRLLPLAADRGIAVIANRPFMHKRLFKMFAHHPLPDWASEFGAQNWAQFFLKFIIADKRVTTAIPATSQIPHIKENMGALYGPLPDQDMRQRMIKHIESL